MRKIKLTLAFLLLALMYIKPSFACGGCPGEDSKPSYVEWLFTIGIIVTSAGMIIFSVILVSKAWKYKKKRP